MPLTNCPFTAFEGRGEQGPVLPMKIVNPQNGLSLSTYGIIDTGASWCAIPEYIAMLLGHDLENGALRKKPTGTANGTVMAYVHSAIFEISHPQSGTLELTTDKFEVYVLPRLKMVLLGVKGFLDQFILNIDYPNKFFSIYKK